MSKCPECKGTGNSTYDDGPCAFCWGDATDGWMCPTCRGSGTVNPLTAPKGFFCVATTDCPHCEGSGETC